MVATNQKTETKRGKSIKTSSSGFKKAPQAPRRFKSPYILFSIHKIQTYKRMYKNAKVTSFSSMVSKEWKSISAEEKQKWKEAAERDKKRYYAEKLLYKGPWQVPSDRTRKDPTAPKRPPSAFLNYCRLRRQELIEDHPNVKNTDISKLLGIEWGTISQEMRQPHIDKEARERALYNKKMAEWKEQQGFKSEKQQTIPMDEKPEKSQTSLPAQMNHISIPPALRRVSFSAINCVSNRNTVGPTSRSMENQAWPSFDSAEQMSSQSHRYSSLFSSRPFSLPEQKPIYPEMASCNYSMRSSTPVVVDDTTPLPITADTPLSFGVQNPALVTPVLNPRQTVSIADYEELFRLTSREKGNNNPQFDSLFNGIMDIDGMD